ncbi:hypothetical protein [Pseudomonas sp. G2-4]|uniref:hypothetical protein n=1 Tax=Pseudomonas sp. G2-4 TaxID=1506334 RepID=UPI0024BB3D5A|nr:hypothetical protein [Pseudomonas sp. G2-4]WHS62341.1 hypothetical protein QNH97_09980 [Pseudomonas sp. G2-4]
MPVIAYHGTSSRHRASLTAGLQPVPNNWGGGELGHGFYCVTAANIETARVYGGQACNDVNEQIDIWSVSCAENLIQLTGGAVGVTNQWAGITDFLLTNYDYLYNQAEAGNISQVKFNPRFYDRLTLSLVESNPYN